MRVLVAIDAHFVRVNDVDVVSRRSFLPPDYFHRYLDVYPEVLVLARVARGRADPADGMPVTNDRIRFHDLPDFHGPSGYLRHLPELVRKASEAVDRTDAAVLRVGGNVSDLAWRRLRHRGRPYGLEVVGDPYDVFARGSVNHPLRPFFRWWFPHILRRQCAQASAIAYVTDEVLQRRYPAAPGALTVSCSDIELADSALVDAPRPLTSTAGRPLTILTVGTLAQLYKGPDILIRAVARCVREGLDLRLVLLGDGKFRPQLEAETAALGIADRVTFRGQVPAGPAVVAELDRADLFALPSRTEGVPKAIIEAMARGLPAIGTRVGGIPELLTSEDLVPPGDAEALAAKIREVLSDPERMARMSARGLARARDYRAVILNERRAAVYRRVLEDSEAWARRTSRPGRLEPEPEALASGGRG